MSFNEELSKANAVADDLLEKMQKPRVGSHVTWNSSGGPAFGRIKRIINSGEFAVPKTKIVLNASKDEPVAVIELHDKEHKATGQIVGHKLSSVRPA